MKYTGTYTIEEDKYTLDLEYEYYYDPGSWEQPPEEEVEVYKATYNGEDFTNFFWDFLEDSMYDQVLEYAQDNFPS